MEDTPMEMLIYQLELNGVQIGQDDKDRYLGKETQGYIDFYNQGYRDGEQADSSDIKKDVQYFDDANNYFINKFKK